MNFERFLICLGVCFLLSFLIGIERQYRRRIIGLRTTILVSVGSFLFVSMSFYLSNEQILGNDDLTRIASQVVTGIGFLGAGVIIKDGFKVRGLTTAATLWCDAAIGVLCATGALPHAIVGTGVILFSNIVLRYANRLVNQKSYNHRAVENYSICISCTEQVVVKIKDIINEFLQKNNHTDITIQSLEIKTENDEKMICINVSIRKFYHMYIDKLVNNIYLSQETSAINYKKISEAENEEEEEL